MLRDRLCMPDVAAERFGDTEATLGGTFVRARAEVGVRVSLTADGQEWALEPGTAVRVGAAQRRNIVTADEPLQMLALGGVLDARTSPRRSASSGRRRPSAA